MSSTNKTTNYDLSQFIGSDKPAWLTDYNQDMAKIDAGIDTAQDTATGADGKAEANTTKIGDLSYLSTSVKTTLVGAINEVDTNADTAQNTADALSSSISSLQTAVTNLTNYIDISNTSDVSSSIQVQNGTIQNSRLSVKVAKNAAGTLGKIYGYARIKPTSTGNIYLKYNADSGLRPAENITINSTVIGGPQQNSNNSSAFTGTGLINIKTDGTFEIKYYADVADRWYELTIIPCLLFMQNFGDIEPSA